MQILVVLTAVMLAAVAVAFTAMLVAWRERDEPGALPLVVLLLGACLWLSSYLFSLQASTVGGQILWNEIAWVGVMIVPVAWLAFAMEYTGRDRYATPTHLAALSVVPLVTVALALTSESHSLLYQQTEMVPFQGQLLLNRVPGPWFWVVTGYTYVLLALGSILILELVLSDSSPFRGQSGALLVGMVFPWVSNVLYIAGVVSIPAFDPTPIAFALSGVAYLAAVTQFQLFDATPSASKHAQRLFIDQLQEGAIVVDSNGFVVEINDTGARTLGLDRWQALGRKAADAIEQFDAFKRSRSSDSVTIADDTDRLYDVTHTEITNSRNRIVGSIYTLHDVSDYVRDQQRHRVLNRLFRHNVRTKTNLIISHAELLADDTSRGDLSLVRESAFGIESTAEKAREVLDVFKESRHPVTPASLSALLMECRRELKRDYPDAVCHFEDVPADVSVPAVLKTAYANAVTNAIAHNHSEPAQVWVRVETDEGRVAVTVADDGPGLDSYERSAIEEGLEDDLTHGSGLGLWLVKWATEIAGGDLEFADRDPSGTVLTITSPQVDDGLRQPEDEDAHAEPL